MEQHKLNVPAVRSHMRYVLYQWATGEPCAYNVIVITLINVI